MSIANEGDRVSEAWAADHLPPFPVAVPSSRASVSSVDIIHPWGLSGPRLPFFREAVRIVLSRSEGSLRVISSSA